MNALSNSIDYTFHCTLKRITIIPAMGLLVFFLLLLGMIGYLLWTMSWQDYTNRIISRALAGETMLLDVQTGIRGYVLTGDPEQLKPYTLNRPTVGQTVASIEGMVQHNPQQAMIANQWDRDAATWLDWIDVELHQFQQTGQRPTADVFQDGLQRFNRVRAEADAFLANEYDIRDQRSATASRVTIFTVSGIVLVLGVLGIWQATFVRRGLRETTGRYQRMVDLAERRNEHIKAVVIELDRELMAVAEIQRSLLPIQLPHIPRLQIAASYQTSKRAGGDYYDFFRLPLDESVPPDQAKWGILIADVSGHGTPAAVLMAVTHAIAHGIERPLDAPSKLLQFVNQRLCDGYTSENAAFVTAFFGVYDPATCTLDYSSAGHNPPRFLRKNESIFQALDEAQGLPLGVDPDEVYPDAAVRMGIGDTLVLYTDGWVEARDATDELFGIERLEAVFNDVAHLPPPDMIGHAIGQLKAYVGERPPQDDCTLLVMQVTDGDSQHQPAQTIVTAELSAMDELDAALAAESAD